MAKEQTFIDLLTHQYLPLAQRFGFSSPYNFSENLKKESCLLRFASLLGYKSVTQQFLQLCQAIQEIR